MHKLHKSCVPLFWFFVPFYKSLPLIMGIIANHNGLGFVGNKCWGVIGFNVLLLVVPPITLLLVSQVRCYPCHLWEAPLMLTILVHRMDGSNWSLLWLSHGRYWFFSYSLDLYVFFFIRVVSPIVINLPRESTSF